MAKMSICLRSKRTIRSTNAALKNQEKESLILLRNQAYIGVLIDDLISKGTDEPYRLFTSRAEYRLLLREDNADLRLAQTGYDIGLLPEENYQMFQEKRSRIAKLKDFIGQTHILPKPKTNERLQAKGLRPLTGRECIQEFLKKPEHSLNFLESLDDQEPLAYLKSCDDAVKKTVETEVKYEGYIARQALQIQKYLKIESIQIPEPFDYNCVGGLSIEVMQKLQKNRPQTLGQASKISGVTPAAITVLMVAFEKLRKRQAMN